MFCLCRNMLCPHRSILGLSPTSPLTIQVLRARYHALVVRHHPDSGGDEETMKRINSAYKALRDQIPFSSSDSQQPKAASPNASTVAWAECSQRQSGGWGAGQRYYETDEREKEEETASSWQDRENPTRHGDWAKNGIAWDF